MYVHITMLNKFKVVYIACLFKQSIGKKVKLPVKLKKDRKLFKVISQFTDDYLFGTDSRKVNVSCKCTM